MLSVMRADLLRVPARLVHFPARLTITGQRGRPGGRRPDVAVPRHQLEAATSPVATAPVIAGRFTEGGLEHAAEVAEVVEAPAGGQGADRLMELGAVAQILAAMGQP